MAIIGKNVIENLTLGMYENSLMIYREYIQNAADSIDNAINLGILKKGTDKNNINLDTKETAQIDIYIDQKKRNISIYDNALGIPKDKFFNILSSIADSEKDKTSNKGFRGIGRLAGLAYCKKLIFTSSYIGENKKSIMIWDGELLKNILNDTQDHISASDLIDKVIDYKTEECDVAKHFFEVTLKDISPENNELLNIKDVYDYLSFVAPVPYVNSFIYASKIKEFIKENNLKLDEYDILVNGKPLFKPYKTHLLTNNKTYDEIKDIEFRKIYSKDNILLAWMWFAVIKFEKNIPIENKMRSIRLRKENIQIGNETTLSNFFKEPRGINYFIGEVMVIDKNLIPNARRDYFNINETLREFETALLPILNKEAYSLYHYANKVKISFRKQHDIIKKENEFNLKIQHGDFYDKKDELDEQKKLEAEQQNLSKIINNINKLKNKSKESPLYTRIFNTIKEDFQKKDIESNIIETSKENIIKTSSTSKKDNENNINTIQEKYNKKKKYKVQELSKYNKREQKLITRIYSKIKELLPKDMAEDLIDKIQEDLKSE
ncbi:ATP-binding protein [uncultured Megamonas sp.]|uniref:ATP-binding protein n=1 Tax=uncultured Megamonas sp. TaxID=286140 RepID=UPI0025EBC530|nr:ATP-binding protein [uncultured Megamonas sp.]